MNTVYKVLVKNARKYGSQPYLHIPQVATAHYQGGEVTLSFKEMLDRVELCSSIYKSGGYGVCHRVALAMEHRADFFIHWLALNRLGASVGVSCIGKQSDLMEIKLINEAGKEVPRGQQGEALIKAAGDNPRKGFFSGAWVQQAHKTSTSSTSVCTGALILGAAGILDGLSATTHWMFHDALRDFGTTPTLQHVVHEGKVFTTAGVSSGIGMALTLAAAEYGDDIVQEIQLIIEYDPELPFNAGSPAKAPQYIIDSLQQKFAHLAQ